MAGELGLGDLAARTEELGPDLAVFLVYDRPQRVQDRPDLERAYFSQRCVSDEQLAQTIDAMREVGAYVELFPGEVPFMEALAEGRVSAVDRPIKLVYNGIEGGIGVGGFKPGRKALLPAVADAYDLVCANSNAYACALGRHKFHYLTVLRAAGLPTPEAWHHRGHAGWVGGRAPEAGRRVIVKSTFESWSVGVHEDSVFIVDDDCERRVAAVVDSIGQSATVQQFVSGVEVCVPVYDGAEVFTTPPVEAILAKAPHDPDAIMTIEDNLTASGVGHERLDRGPAVDHELRALACEAFDVLELSSFARIDLRLDAEDRPWIFDVGVSPGISRKSSAFESAAELGLDHAAFLRAVVGASLPEAAALA